MPMPPELDVRLAWLRDKPGVKWHSTAPGMIAAWLADMDFPAPPPVRDAIAALAGGGDLGYPAWLRDDGTPLREAFADRMAQRHGWSPDPVLVREFTDIQQAVQAVLYVATAPGDAVALHVPGYPPLSEAVQAMGRRLVAVPMELTASGWILDNERLRQAVVATQARVVLLVNPHNPTGRCFARPDLAALADLAAEHDLLVIADEIHADLTLPPATFVPFASLSPQTAARTVTLTSASKAFNLAGMRCAVAHIGSARVLDGLGQLPPNLLGELGSAGVLATLAAWEHADGWLADVCQVLDHNRRLLDETLAPLGVGYHIPEATYLAWLDCRALDLPAEPAPFFRERARVRLSSGASFGAGYEGFARLNYATSPAVLSEVCKRIAAAVADR